MSDERGYTIIELLVGMMMSLVVLGAILMMVQVATKNQDRVSERVYANQRGRPVMTHIIDALHAACVSPGLAPVLAGSNAESMTLLSKSGSSVSPVPNKYAISLSGGAISEVVSTGTEGEPPEWKFGAPSSPRQLLDGVAAASLGDPPVGVPLFRYFAYEDANKDGAVETVPLEPPLSSEEAARTVQVNVAFEVAPYAGSSADPGAPIVLTDSATLRIEPASEDSAQVNRPCV